MQLFRNHILVFLIAQLCFSSVRGHDILVDLIDEEAIECTGGENLEEAKEGKNLPQFGLDSDPALEVIHEVFLCGYWSSSIEICPSTSSFSHGGFSCCFRGWFYTTSHFFPPP